MLSRLLGFGSYSCLCLVSRENSHASYKALQSLTKRNSTCTGTSEIDFRAEHRARPAANFDAGLQGQPGHLFEHRPPQKVNTKPIQRQLLGLRQQSQSASLDVTRRRGPQPSILASLPVPPLQSNAVVAGSSPVNPLCTAHCFHPRATHLAYPTTQLLVEDLSIGCSKLARSEGW